MADRNAKENAMRMLWVLVLASGWAGAQQNGMVHGKDGITLPPAPGVKTVPVVDSYASAASSSAVRLTDNYRWLEDAKSPDTRAFISAENTYTDLYLKQVKILPQVRTEMSALLKVDFVSTPQRRGTTYFFSKRLASENQASIYMRTGLHGDDVKLVDAMTMSSDQNSP